MTQLDSAIEFGPTCHVPAITSVHLHETDTEFRFLRAAQCSRQLLNEVTAFLDAQDTSHPFQLPLWSGAGDGYFVMNQGGRISWLGQAGEFQPGGRLFRTVRAAVFNRGPICDDLETMDAGLRELVQGASAMGMAYLDILPEWTGGFAESAKRLLAEHHWFPISDARLSLRLDLTPTLDGLLGSFRKRTRYEIRKSTAAGVTVARAENDAELGQFAELYTNMANARNFAAVGPSLLTGVFHALIADPRRGAFFLARHGEELLGGVLVIRAGTRCWYVLGATAKEQKVNAGHLLQWHAIQWAKQIGCVEYDFCGYNEHTRSGPALFKRGFCGRVVRFLPAHRRVLSPARYRVFNLLSKAARAVAQGF